MKKINKEGESASAAAIRRGYVPMVVGKGKEEEERVAVHTKLFSHPRFVVLLEMAEQEFGYHQPGVLRIPCDAEQFRSVVSAATASVRDKL